MLARIIQNVIIILLLKRSDFQLPLLVIGFKKYDILTLVSEVIIQGSVNQQTLEFVHSIIEFKEESHI